MGSRLTVCHDTPPAATAAGAMAELHASAGQVSCWDACLDRGVSTCCDAVYVHVPFCRHRCHYCDFFTIAGRDDARSAYVDRLLQEARHTVPQLPVAVGGGQRGVTNS